MCEGCVCVRDVCVRDVCVRDYNNISGGTEKIANIYGSRDTLPIPLYIISDFGNFNVLEPTPC